MNVLLPTLGSSGDVNPFIGLGLALQARGHRVRVLTNGIFKSLVESHGLGFIPIGSIGAAEAAINNPDVWHVRRGFRIIAQLLTPAIGEVFHLIERHADSETVVAFSTLAFGARLAQEKLGIPSASVHLQPSVIRTYGDQGMLGNVRLSAAPPRFVKEALFRLVDWVILDRHLAGPLNALRAQLGLRPVSRVMHRWMHSPELVLAFFPSWFAAPQPDWPPNTHTVGFPMWDGGSAAVKTVGMAEAQAFLAAGSAPLIFTAGSAAATMQEFFSESVHAAALAGRRAMLLTNFPDQLPRDLPTGVRAFGYVPFSWLLPHAALLAYHGGIGTLAQVVRAGVPQLVVPHGFDQFDNGWRIERLGLGRVMPAKRYQARSVAAAISQLLDANNGQRAAFAAKIDGAAALTRACELLEGLRRKAT